MHPPSNTHTRARAHPVSTLVALTRWEIGTRAVSSLYAGSNRYWSSIDTVAKWDRSRIGIVKLHRWE